MPDLVIFGAGAIASTLYEWAAMARYSVIFFVDNDPHKWGSTICGIKVGPVKWLVSSQYKVLIGEKYRDEMVHQLKEQAFEGEIIFFNDLIREIVSQERRTSLSCALTSKAQINYVFDAYFLNTVWGGIESWSCFVANALKAHKRSAVLMCGDNPRFDREIDTCIHFNGECETDIVRDMVDELQKKLPCVVIARTSLVLYAALIVQKRFPEQVKIILVVHGLEPQEYQFETIAYWAGNLNAVVCVSREIETVLRENYKIPSQKLLYRMNPIPLPKKIVKRKQTDKLKIAFAARLQKLQKRADLLPKFIDMCLNKGLNVEFNIAGEGDCSELIEEYIISRHLEDKVHLLGWIPQSDMASFWMEQDIYLSLSTYEGMSLSMLEAMACGVVPVVTDVSGVRDLIEDGKNGAIVPVNQWEQGIEKISVACCNREWLKKASAYNIGLLKEKCDVEHYADWIEQTFRLDKSD